MDEEGEQSEEEEEEKQEEAIHEDARTMAAELEREGVNDASQLVY